MILQGGYEKMSSISTYFKIGDEQADNIKKAADILVCIDVGKLRTDSCWRSIVN
jgi:hypothetical protein